MRQPAQSPETCGIESARYHGRISFNVSDASAKTSMPREKFKHSRIGKCQTSCSPRRTILSTPESFDHTKISPVMSCSRQPSHVYHPRDVVSCLGLQDHILPVRMYHEKSICCSRARRGDASLGQAIATGLWYSPGIKAIQPDSFHSVR